MTMEIHGQTFSSVSRRQEAALKGGRQNRLQGKNALKSGNFKQLFQHFTNDFLGIFLH